MKIISIKFDDYNTEPDFIAVNDDEVAQIIERLKGADTSKSFIIEEMKPTTTLEEALEMIRTVSEDGEEEDR